MPLKIVDCSKAGITLENSEILDWNQIEVIGKCEYPGRDLPWDFFYVRRKGEKKNRRLSSLNTDLKLKLLELGEGQTAFVTKTTHFGKEIAWNVENDIKLCRYYISPEAKQIRHHNNWPIIICVIGLSLLGLALFLFCLNSF